jgi:hypothetical protein
MWATRQMNHFKNLGRCNSFSVRPQSAMFRRVAENCCKRFSTCGHAIPADWVTVRALAWGLHM